MDKSTAIYLVTETHEEDAMHVFTTSYEERQIFAHVDSVTGREWHDGGRHGLNPELRFTVFSWDYMGEELIRYYDAKMNENRYYSIYRTYQRTKDELELYTERRKGTDLPGTV